MQSIYDLKDLFSTFSDISCASTCASDIGNLWSICLGVNLVVQV